MHHWGGLQVDAAAEEAAGELRRKLAAAEGRIETLLEQVDVAKADGEISAKALADTGVRIEEMEAMHAQTCQEINSELADLTAQKEAAESRAEEVEGRLAELQARLESTEQVVLDAASSSLCDDILGFKTHSFMG